jgi:hypothetical protein
MDEAAEEGTSMPSQAVIADTMVRLRKERERNIRNALLRAGSVDTMAPPSNPMPPSEDDLPEDGMLSLEPTPMPASAPTPTPQASRSIEEPRDYGLATVPVPEPKLPEQQSVDYGLATVPVPENIVRASRDTRINPGVLMGLRNISEGFGNIRAWTAGHIRNGVEPPGPYIAQDIRQAEEINDDKLSPEEIDQFRSQGLGVPEGARRSDLKSYMGAQQLQNDASLQTHNMLAKAQQASDVERRFQERLRESQASRAQRARLAERVEPQDAQGLASGENSIEMLRKVIDAKPGVNTGPLRDIWEKLANYMGVASANYAEFKAKLGSVVTAEALRLGGKTLTANEARMLHMTIPEASDDDQVFMSKAKSALEIMRSARRKELQALRAAGRDVSQFNNWTPMLNRQTGEVMEVSDPDAALEVLGPDGTPIWEMYNGQ